jgi:hypothetical protein
MLLLLSPLPVAITIPIAVAVAVLITVAIPIPIVAVSIPSYYGWLFCVGWRVLDIMDIFIASLIVIVIIIVSLPSPAEEHRVETRKGGKRHGGNHLGVDTAPSPCCGRAGEESERMFSPSSSSTTSLRVTVFSGAHQQNFAGASLLLAQLLPQKPRQQNLRCASKISDAPAKS